jgi:hypothetical protein
MYIRIACGRYLSGMPNILVPILIGKSENKNYWFSQVIRLCVDRDTLSKIDISSEYNDVTLGCTDKNYRPSFWSFTH